MLRGRLAIGVAAALFAGSPLSAQETPSPIPDVPAEPDAKPEAASIVVKGKGEKKVCRTVVATGSIVPRRTCKTEAEVEAEAAAAQAMVERLRTDQETAQQIKELRDVK